MNPKSIAGLELSLLALVVALFFWWIRPNAPTVPTNPLVATGTTTVQELLFPYTPVEAGSAFVYDARDGKVLYAKDPDSERPLASLTKLMTALTATEIVPEYVLVRIAVDDIRQEGDSGLYVGEEWNIRDLVDFSLVTSSNDGIQAVARAAGLQISSTSTMPVELFVRNMNAAAKKIGLTDMRFANASGLDIDKTTSGAYGSARDVAYLVDHIMKTDRHLIEATALQQTTISSHNYPHTAVNTDLAIPNIPNLIGSKTGYTDLSGGNLVVAFNAGLNHPVIISVLGSSYDGRFKDLEVLVRSTIQYLNARSAAVK
ncbi:MAG TPA: hypothetical protein VHD69_02660 [Candidatus Paceibacterota bacterium]|jgi:D-alanyl-D-alanine carboxypeptidase (penicillin-binding protein 5/6)|nr:hypothetical protein [Candidatus Paceibacterota bacterium]